MFFFVFIQSKMFLVKNVFKAQKLFLMHLKTLSKLLVKIKEILILSFRKKKQTKKTFDLTVTTRKF